MPDRDATPLTVFIDGFVKKGYFEQGLQWFREMQVSQVVQIFSCYLHYLPLDVAFPANNEIGKKISHEYSVGATVGGEVIMHVIIVAEYCYACYNCC